MRLYDLKILELDQSLSIFYLHQQYLVNYCDSPHILKTKTLPALNFPESYTSSI